MGVWRSERGLIRVPQTLEVWKFGVWKCVVEKFGSLEVWKFGTEEGFRVWKFGSLEMRNKEDWKFGSLEEWKVGSLVDWKFGRS